MADNQDPPSSATEPLVPSASPVISGAPVHRSLVRRVGSRLKYLGGRAWRAPADALACWKLCRGDGRARAHFEAYPPVFIVGAPRSGTTLLLQVLSTQPLCTRNWEPFRLWERVFGYTPDDANLGRVDWRRRMALRAQFFAHVEPERPILVSKDPRDSLRVRVLREVFPTAKFVHIVRDGRDVTASIIKAFEKGGKYHVEPGWAHVRFPGYRRVFNEPHHRKAALMWRACVDAIVRDFENVPPENRTTVRYEDLVARPEEEGSRLLRMVWPEYSHGALMALVPFISDKVDAAAHGGASASAGGFETRWVRSDVPFDAGSGTLSNSIRIGKWQSELSPDVLRECEQILGPMLEHFGYVGVPVNGAALPTQQNQAESPCAPAAGGA